MHPLLLWEDLADDQRNRTLAHAFRGDMQRWSVGATYPNFLGDEGAARMSAAFGASAPRLAAIKARWTRTDASAPSRRSALRRRGLTSARHRAVARHGGDRARLRLDALRHVRKLAPPPGCSRTGVLAARQRPVSA